MRRPDTTSTRRRTSRRSATGSDPDLHPNIDWVDRLYKDYSFNQRVNVNISGGGSTAKYYISGGFYNEDGLFKADNMKEYNTSVFYRRFNFRSNVEVQLHKYTKLNINLATTFERQERTGARAPPAPTASGAMRSRPQPTPSRTSIRTATWPARRRGQGENPLCAADADRLPQKSSTTRRSRCSC